MTVWVLAVALCLSVCVCLSQVGVLSKWMDGSSWFLACRLSAHHTLCSKEIQVSTKIRALPSGTLSHTPDLKKIDSVCRSPNMLSTQLEKGGHPERDKLDRHLSNRLIIPPSSDSRPLQFMTHGRQALSTARYSRAGRQLATADTCYILRAAAAAAGRWHDRSAPRLGEHGARWPREARSTLPWTTTT